MTPRGLWRILRAHRVAAAVTGVAVIAAGVVGVTVATHLHSALPPALTGPNAPATHTAKLPVYPSCPGKPQPDYWSKPDALYGVIPAGMQGATVHATVAYSDGVNSVCDYQTKRLLVDQSIEIDPTPAGSADSTWHPCEWTATHGNYTAQSVFRADGNDDGLEAAKRDHTVDMIASAASYHGPGSYSAPVGGPGEAYSFARYSPKHPAAQTGVSSSVRSGTFQITTRADGSGVVTFSGGGHLAITGQGLKDTTITATLTWVCDDPPWPVVTPSTADGRNSSYSDQTPVDRGSLDFANQTVGSEISQPLTITNSGTGPMWMHYQDKVFDDIRGPGTSAPVITDFRVDPSGCTAAPLAAGGRCTMTVTFAPGSARAVGAFFFIWYNGPGTGFNQVLKDAPAQLSWLVPPIHVSLKGTGTPVSRAPLSVDPSETSLNVNAACHVQHPGWGLANPAQPLRTLTGQVVEGHVPTEDSTSNHNSMDYNWFVYPDARYRDLLANPANFGTGDGYEWGRIESEWEQQILPGVPGGIPSWAWAGQGDRIWEVGYHIADCGHTDTGYRSEIHPPQALVVYRNAALAPFNGSSRRRGSEYQGQWATRADIFASNYGGGAIDSEDLGHNLVPIYSSQDYSFSVVAPPQPSPDATLAMAVVPQQVGAGAVTGTVSFTTLTVGHGYRGTIHIEGDASKLREVGETVYVYWQGGPDWLRPDVHTVTVTVEQLSAIDRQTMGGDWTAHAYVNGQAKSLLRGGGTTPLGLQYVSGVEIGSTYCGPGAAGVCTGPLQDNVFTVTVVDDQPLHVDVRVLAHQAISLGAGMAMGTAEHTFTGDPSTWEGEYLVSSQATFSAGSEEIGPHVFPAACTNGCFTVRLRVATG